MVQWGPGGADRARRAKLQGACARYHFDMVKLPSKGAFQLVDRDIGHAVINGSRGTTAFNVQEALSYFRARELEAADVEDSGSEG
jgi:hypothetical protein